jgi:hypothetical protein
VGRYLEASDALCLRQADFSNWQLHEVIDQAADALMLSEVVLRMVGG